VSRTEQAVQRARSWWKLAIFASLAFAPACSEDPPVEDGEQLEEPEADIESCGEETPLVTWATFGQGFVRTNCQGCHSSDAADRHGAPETIVFDTPKDVGKHRAAILAAVGADVPTMPPAGGVLDQDRARLRIWLGCFAGE
jgi:uncharacterized membrane protein